MLGFGEVPRTVTIDSSIQSVAVLCFNEIDRLTSASDEGIDLLKDRSIESVPGKRVLLPLR